MNERLVKMSYNLTDPTDAAALAALTLHEYIPFGLTIVAVSAAPMEDDAGATIDINDDGTGVITAVDASDADVPGTWLSTHVGGTETPVVIAAGSELSIDVNLAASGNRIDISVWALVSETLA